MKKHFIFLIFIFLVNCSFNESELGISSNSKSQNEINSSKEYSFEEYVNLLLNMNKSKNYPDINNIPD